MRVTRKEGRVIGQAIAGWLSESVITQDEADRLSNAYEIIPFDWKRLAKYAFWLAIASVVTAVCAALADRWLASVLQRFFAAPEWIKSGAFAMLAATLYFLGIRRKAQYPGKLYSNEAILFLAVLATAASIMFLGRALDTGTGHFSLLLLAALVYGGLGLWFSSTLVWIFALLSLGGWLGAETGYASGWGAYYLGMNYPLRFVLFGLVLIFCGSWLFGSWHQRQEFLKPTRAVGLLYLFVALWLMSIFGNYGDPYLWSGVRQIELFHWSVLFALASAAAIYHGVKYDDAMTSGFGLTFFLINLYTRFFEYFWDATHKTIFFTLLALSFWYLGSRAEKIWQLGRVRKLLE